MRLFAILDISGKNMFLLLKKITFFLNDKKITLVIFKYLFRNFTQKIKSICLEFKKDK